MVWDDLNCLHTKLVHKQLYCVLPTELTKLIGSLDYKIKGHEFDLRDRHLLELMNFVQKKYASTICFDI